MKNIYTTVVGSSLVQLVEDDNGEFVISAIINSEGEPVGQAVSRRHIFKEAIHEYIGQIVAMATMDGTIGKDHIHSLMDTLPTEWANFISEIEEQ